MAIKKKTNSLKGRTFEEIHGTKKARELKKHLSESKKGKTYEEIYGVEVARQKKKKNEKFYDWSNIYRRMETKDK